MDKSMATRRVRTAPASISSATDLLDEVSEYERRLNKRGNRLSNAVSDAWIEGKTAKSTARMAGACVREAFRQIQLDSVAGELKLGRYLCRKLIVASQAGVLDASIDVELAMLRTIIKKLG
jgi:hypothetical protein